MQQGDLSFTKLLSLFLETESRGVVTTPPVNSGKCKSNCFINQQLTPCSQMSPPSTMRGSFSKNVMVPQQGQYKSDFIWNVDGAGMEPTLPISVRKVHLGQQKECFTHLILATFLIEARYLHDCSAVLWLPHDFARCINILVMSPYDTFCGAIQLCGRLSP